MTTLSDEFASQRTLESHLEIIMSCGCWFEAEFIPSTRPFAQRDNTQQVIASEVHARETQIGCFAFEKCLLSHEDDLPYEIPGKSVSEILLYLAQRPNHETLLLPGRHVCVA